MSQLLVPPVQQQELQAPQAVERLRVVERQEALRLEVVLLVLLWPKVRQTLQQQELRVRRQRLQQQGVGL